MQLDNIDLDKPIVYDHPVARGIPTQYAEETDIKLARVFHARSTRVGLWFDQLPEEDRDALVAGTMHVVNAVAEALRSRLGNQTFVEVEAALREGFESGDLAELLRKAESDLADKIEDDRQFRARLKIERLEASLRADS